MTQFELMRTAESLLRVMNDNNIDVSDIKYMKMYDDYRRLKEEGHKVGYIVYYLSEQYGCGETTVYRVVKRMEKRIV